MSTEKQEVKLPTKQVLTFKQNLKKYRKLAYKDGLTFCKSVDSFADHVGINKVTYTAYEAERRSNVPDYDTLIAIAAALEVSIDSLFGRAHPPEQIRFFLSELGIDFSVQIQEKKKNSALSRFKNWQGEKVYLLKVPDDVRKYCNNSYAAVKELIQNNPWELTPKALSFSASQFNAIKKDFLEYSDLFFVGPIFSQLVFFRIVQAHTYRWMKERLKVLDYIVNFDFDVFFDDKQQKEQILTDVLFESLVPDSSGSTYSLDTRKFEAQLSNQEAMRRRKEKLEKEAAQSWQESGKLDEFINKFRGGM